MAPTDNARAEIDACLEVLADDRTNWYTSQGLWTSSAAVSGLLDLIPELLASYDELWTLSGRLLAGIPTTRHLLPRENR